MVELRREEGDDQLAEPRGAEEAQVHLMNRAIHVEMQQCFSMAKSANP